MTPTLLISILLSIVGFIGVLMVKQLMKIAEAVQQIQVEIKGLATDHQNLKDDHIELKGVVNKLQEHYAK
jgi:cell division protein FtsX